jgi:hypothetical protein
MSQSKPGRFFSQKLREIGRIAGARSPIPRIKKDQQRQEEPIPSRFEAVHTPDRLVPGRPTPTEEECLVEIRKWHSMADRERGYILDNQIDPRDPLSPLDPLRKSRGRKAVLGREIGRSEMYEFRDEEEEEEEEEGINQRYHKAKEREGQKDKNPTPQLPTLNPPHDVPASELDSQPMRRRNAKRDTFGFPEDDSPDYTDFPFFTPPRPHRPDNEDLLFSPGQGVGAIAPADMGLRTAGFLTGSCKPPLVPGVLSSGNRCDGCGNMLSAIERDFHSKKCKGRLAEGGLKSDKIQRGGETKEARGERENLKEDSGEMNGNMNMKDNKETEANRETLWLPSQVKGMPFGGVFPQTTNESAASSRSPPPPLRDRGYKARARRPREANSDFPKYENWQPTEPQRPLRENEDADVLDDIYDLYGPSDYI